MVCCWSITFCLALFAVSTGYSIVKGLASLKGTPEEQKKWLLVWAFIAVLFTLEKVTIFLPLIPGYCLVKSLFIVWLYHEKYNGAMLLYTKFVEPNNKYVELGLQYLNKVKIDKILLGVNN